MIIFSSDNEPRCVTIKVYQSNVLYFSTKIQDISKNSTIRDLVSGKLPNQVIQAVFQLVKENSRLNNLIGSKLDMKILDNLELNSIVRRFPSYGEFSLNLLSCRISSNQNRKLKKW